jgi:hypothetical protein
MADVQTARRCAGLFCRYCPKAGVSNTIEPERWPNQMVWLPSDGAEVIQPHRSVTTPIAEGAVPSGAAGRTSAGDPAPYQRHSAPGLMRARRVKKQFLRITWRKLQRAYGGCLGVKRRRRTWNTAKSLGEPCAGAISGDVRMGKPAGWSQDLTGVGG